MDGFEDGTGAVGEGHDIVRARDLREQLLQFGLRELPQLLILLATDAQLGFEQNGRARFV